MAARLRAEVERGGLPAHRTVVLCLPAAASSATRGAALRALRRAAPPVAWAWMRRLLRVNKRRG
eukprot:6182353-Alexandrium_andersonii.AAC.1